MVTDSLTDGLVSVHNIIQKIGYPTKSPDIRNASALQEYYEAVDISSTEFFHNAISVAQFDSRREWSALGKPTDRAEWDMTSPTVNVCEKLALRSLCSVLSLLYGCPFYCRIGLNNINPLGLLQPGRKRNRFPRRHYASSCVLRSFSTQIY